MKTKIMSFVALMLLIASFSVAQKRDFQEKRKSMPHVSIAEQQFGQQKNRNSSMLQHLKSKANWQEPDTVICYNTEETRRYLYTYNANGFPSIILSEILLDSVWINDFVEVYVYDDHNNLLRVSAQNFELSFWANDWVRTCTYDDNDNMVESLMQIWKNGGWVNSSETIYEYDANNHLTNKLTKKWDNDWVNYVKAVLTYNANGNLMTEESYNWDKDTNNWKNGVRLTYAYDDDNNMQTFLNESWYNEVWNSLMKFVYVYDTHNNVSVEFTQYLMEDVWIDVKKNVYTYDNNNNLIGDYLYYSSGENEWKSGKKIDYTYDENNNAILGESWIVSNDNWVEFDDTPEMFYNHMRSSQGYYGYKIVVSYSKVNRLGIKEVDNTLSNSVSVFPNPATGKITITTDQHVVIEQVALFNQLGQQLLRQAKMNNIDLSAFRPGNYFLQIKTNKGIVTKKVIKQ